MGATSSVAAAFPELGTATVRDLERRLLAAAGAGSTDAGVVSVRREPLEGTWYRTEVVSVDLGDGTGARFFLKDFGSFVRAKSRMEARRERERYFYRHVFSAGELGLPKYVADVWDGHKWLVLEMVEGVPLGWCELGVWHEAAAWLGRFQSAVAARVPDLAASGRFTRHAAPYFDVIAERAVEGAGAYDATLAERVRAVLPEYRERAQVLTGQPQTLVHGGFRPAQVLVEATGDPVRICPTDWEIAALGSCLYDLATLADGFEGAALEAFLDAFTSTATWLPAGSATRADLDAALAACRMHRTMKWVAHAHARGMPVEKVRELVASLGPGGKPR